MATFVGFSGSLREASFNTRLLSAAAARMPAGSTLEILAIGEFPLYDQDLEDASGIPAPVAAAKDAIATADGLLIATPEYNGGIPGVAKNVIDWLSRPPRDQARVFVGKPVALIGASMGNAGTASAQAAWLQVLKTLRMNVFTMGGSVFVGRAHTVFDDDGELIDEDISTRLGRYLEAFVASL